MIDRRRFLARSSLALGAAAAPGPLASTARGGEMSDRLKKAIKFHHVDDPKLSTLDKFKLIQDVGFDGTELRTEHREDFKSYREAADKSGLPVHGIINSSKPDLETAVKFASDMGGTSVLYVARYDRSRPLMESWRETQEVIQKGLPAAEEHQVQILVENVWAGFLISALDTQRYVDEIDHPWFGSYFDVGNNVRWGVPHHWIQVLGDRIGKLDIKEWDEKKHRSEGLRAGFGSKLGEGTIDWAAVREALVEIDYRGWATAEVGGGGRERIADIARRMDDVLGLA